MREHDGTTSGNGTSNGTPLVPLRLLQTFATAAQHSNFTRAARELSISQPAVSQQIRQLEDFLGQQLFYRRGPAVRLTDDGRSLADTVAGGLAAICNEVDRLRDSSNRRRLRLRADDTLCAHWLLARLPEFLSEFPDAELDLAVSSGAHVPGVDGGQVHISFGPVPPGAELVLGPQQTVAVARSEVAAQIAKPDDLAHVTLLDTTGGDGWRRFLSEMGITLEPHPITHKSVSRLLTLELARMGQGVALAPLTVAQDMLAGGQLDTIANLVQPSHSHYYLDLPPSSELNTISIAFLDWLRSCDTNSPIANPNP